LLSDFVESGKRTANRKAEPKQEARCHDSQASEENFAEGHGASWNANRSKALMGIRACNFKDFAAPPA